MIDIRAEQQPNRDVLTFEHFSLDNGATPDEDAHYAALRRDAQHLAAYLLNRGMRKGDRFAIMMRNHPEFVEARSRLSLLQRFVHHPRTQGDKLAFMLRHAGCRGVVTARLCACQRASGTRRDASPRMAAGAGQWGAKQPVAPSKLSGIDSMNEVARGTSTPDRCRARRVDRSAAIRLLYLGHTGDPKGIIGDVQRLGRTGWLGHSTAMPPTNGRYTGSPSLTAMPRRRR